MARVRGNVVVKGKNFWALFDGGARNTYVVEAVASLLPTFELEIPESVALGGRTHQVQKECLLTCLVGPEIGVNSIFLFPFPHPHISHISAIILECQDHWTIENNNSQPAFQYRENTTAVMQEDFLKKIRTQLYQGVYGDDDFVRAMKEKLKIGSLRKIGRPRKK